ncbi:YihY/virulence factor BrkB family protein [Candidatus Nitrotoga sp. M5]|uniref:YihY/virulence factor BrkB family protein n=1 Tax=Candidatus Nitrotoga sp. M5 TaxID=2890409 RepID=UPI001EF208AF|nr:YihY/virulence factor BrkB family protein [Candidatus Nitrotoga sp. M5]CAH1385379.1 Ribonuclease BN [Candidatus Nitrotoga sp. M5]
MNIKIILNFIKATFSAWIDDNAPSMGAALAYYTVFSIAPLLLIVISVAGIIFGVEVAREEIIAQLHNFMGKTGALVVQGMLESVSKPTESVTAAIIGVALLMVGATTVFAELQNSLDRIWRAPTRTKDAGIFGLIRTRLLAFGMILGIGFLLTVSLILSAALAILGRWWAPLFGEFRFLANFVDIALSFMLITIAFAMIYKLMPRMKIYWRDVWVGAVVTAILFTIGKFLIGMYIGRSGVASGFGAAGSLVVLLTWIYYSAQIFLMGAEFTKIYSYTFGSRKEQPMQTAAQTTAIPAEQMETHTP